jgi:hypothetical protein
MTADLKAVMSRFHLSAALLTEEDATCLILPQLLQHSDRQIRRSQPYEIFLEPYLQAFFVFFTLLPLDWPFSPAIVELRRELSHREFPDGKLPAPATIASFGVAARCSLTAPSVSEGKFGNTAAGIDSWQRVVRP